jgi:predicted RNA-binding Zn ribbon-like protein
MPSTSPRHSEDLAIRFVNTMAWRLRNPAEERLGSPDALLAWLLHNAVISAAEGRRLKSAWKARPDAAGTAYAAALRLREAIYGLCLGLMRGQAPSESSRSGLAEFLWGGAPALRLHWEDGGLTWRASWQAGDELADSRDLLRPIALSAAALVTGTRAHRIKQCEDDRGCGWLFVDDSRLQNRRWCAMGDCGNVAKARRHRKRLE